MADNNEDLRKLLQEAIFTKSDPRARDVLDIEPEEVTVSNKPKCVKKRRCANCSCSRSKEKTAELTSEKPKSNCGSCYLGDAFRCDGCPYKGMPAFKPGEEFKFDDQMNDL